MPLDRINTDPPKVTVGSFLRGLWSATQLAFCLLSTCEHKKTRYLNSYMQFCDHCGRVRVVFGTTCGHWHREAR